MSAVRHVYAVALRAYPSGYRRAHAAELTSTLHEVVGDPPRLVVRELVGLLVGGLRQRVRGLALLGGRHAAAEALVVVVVGLAFVGLQWSSEGGSVRPGTGPVAFAPESPAYSHLTADVEHAPIGRAVALYQQGMGVEFFDTPQALVLGADETATRRIGLATDRGRHGDAGPMLLSPDGRLVIVGDLGDGQNDLALVDLSSGGVRRLQVPLPGEVHPLAWAPDGGTVAYSVGDGLHLLDLATGASRSVPRTAGVDAAAFSPTAPEIAVQLRWGGPDVLVFALDGARLRTLDMRGGSIGPNSWSPDGRLIAVEDDGTTVGFVRADGALLKPPVVVPVPGAGGEYRGRFAGWAGSSRPVFMVAAGTAGAPGRARLLATNLAGGEVRQLTKISTHAGNEAVSSRHFAADLLPGAGVRPAGDWDRGPLPLWFRFGVVLAVAALSAWVVRFAGSWARRRERRLVQRLAVPEPT